MMFCIITQQKLQTSSIAIFQPLARDILIKLSHQRKELMNMLGKICPNPKSMYWMPVTNSEIKTIIHKLSNKRSSGYDHIDNLLLKLLCDELCPSLCVMANMSIAEGLFPDAMKLAEVFPLFKNKDKTVTTNYRPISLLLTLSKVLEKVIYKRTYDFLNTSGQIYCSQYGFRTKHSCENAIQELLSQILKGLETGKIHWPCSLISAKHLIL